jgi:AcrR family transcriptional regulator
LTLSPFPDPASRPAPAADAHRGGRRRDDARDVALLDAALELVASVGYERVTMDAIAAHARASKATIYRRWPGKAQLVTEAVHRRVAADEPAPDCGSLRGDLLHLVRRACVSVAGVDGGVLAGLAGAARSDPELAGCIRSMCESKACVFDEPLARAAARGEPAPRADGATLSEVVVGLVVFHAIQGDRLGDELAEHLVDDIALPLLSSSPQPPEPTERLP